jgi:glucose/arabinose dehydrogenase
MKIPAASVLALSLSVSVAGVAVSAQAQDASAAKPVLGAPTQPEPYATKSVINHPRTIGWPEGRTPVAPRGYEVVKFAGGLEYPRQALLLPNGDVLVSEARTKPKLDADPEVARGQALSKTTGYSANRITLLRDADADGVAEQRFVLREGLNQPFGLQYATGKLSVANTDGVVSFPFQPGQTRITAASRTLVSLPAGGYNNHWTRNLLLSPDARTLYVSVGSASNVGEYGMGEEKRRAAILAIDLASGRERIYASGLRNPVGLAWNPESGLLWTSVNERDEIGDDLVPDYMTSVKPGGFYGWPYSYYGQHVDERVRPQNPDLVARAIAPDYALGAHTASLGLTFYDGTLMPRYRNGAFVGQHGSWNRSRANGYKVIFVPFAGGQPAGPPQDVLTGFLNRNGEAQGRPVGVQTDRLGGLLVADDVGNVVWRVGPAT